MTNIVNNLDRNKDRVYEFDTLGRLRTAKAGLSAGATGVTANWTEGYTYDRYGNRQTVTPNGVTANNQAVPADGLPSQSYDAPSNRITTSGYLYDLMGNLTRGQDASGNWQTYEYDQAGRMLHVRDASNNILETHFYAADRNRYAVENPSQRTYYVWGGASVLEEYTEPLAGNTPTYSKSYVYAGSRLLSTYTNNGGTETLQLQHPDRLGTKLVTNPQSATQYEQATLPFGTSLDAETTGTTNQRFTTYDRSAGTGLDYAVNRSYSSGQGRFTSVDPAQDGSNLYAYAGNDPVNNVDPSGLNLSSPDPMGVSYYVDGFLSDARTAWAHIEGGGAEYIWSTVGGVTGDVYAQYTGSIKEPRLVGIRQEFHVWMSSQALPDYINEVYEGKLGKKLTKCINKVFARKVTVTKNGRTFEMKGSDVIGLQNKKNAPKVDDTSYSSFVLGGGMKGHEAYGRYWAQYNTLFIANDIGPETGNVGGNTITVSAKELEQRTYVHELGNHLSDLITKGDPSYFGDPKGVLHEFDPKWEPDFDTGANLESCVFGSQRP